MGKVVLDASAVLALLQGEAGADRVRDALRLSSCYINSVNLAEVVGKLVERLGDRLCLVSGVQEQAPVLTADQIWLKVQPGPKVELIRS